MLLLVLLTYLPPSTDSVREHFHQIEVNYCWNETCETDPLQYRITFVQVLFREFNEHTKEHEIQAWRMMKGIEEPGEPARTLMAPTKNAATGKYEMRWIDGDVNRIVTADSFFVSHTLGDPEVWERERFPKEDRRELLPAKAVRK